MWISLECVLSLSLDDVLSSRPVCSVYITKNNPCASHSSKELIISCFSVSKVVQAFHAVSKNNPANNASRSFLLCQVLLKSRKWQAGGMTQWERANCAVFSWVQDAGITFPVSIYCCWQSKKAKVPLSPLSAGELCYWPGQERGEGWWHSPVAGFLLLTCEAQLLG